MLGVAYKKNIDDMRESPAVEIIEQLRAAGSTVDYSDPHVSKLPAMRRHELDMSSVTLDGEVLGSYDCVVLTTDHDSFDYELILDASHLIIDTRGRFRNPSPKVVQA